MIFIQRNRKDENGKLITPNKKWHASAKKATSKALKEKGKHKPSSSIYASPNVRAALEKLFHYKCSYCESSLARFDWEVEHYRPKGAVAKNKKHPGYYWLVYDWNNLFPSCVHCNQSRKDKPIWGDLKEAGSGGKGTQFPLESGSIRIMDHKGSISKEKCLLLNPSKDYPEKYITFGLEGQAIAIDDSAKGVTSIQVYNLRSRRLRIERKKIVDTVVGLLKEVKNLKSSGNEEFAMGIFSVVKKHFLADNCNYAAVARAVVSKPEAFGI